MPIIPEPFNFPDSEVLRLGEQLLVYAVRELVRHEIESAALSVLKWSVSQKTKAKDGGLDGFVQWEGGPDQTNHFPSRWVGFQIKATSMPPADCKKELLDSNGKLSPEVDELLRGGGTYVLVVHDEVNPNLIKDRIEKMREAVQEGSDLNPEEAKLEIYDAERVARWMREHLPLVHDVRSRLGFRVYPSLCNWRQWKQLLHGAPRLAVPQEYKARITSLRENLSKSEAIVRLTGQAGLGKTRLGLEATRPENEEDTGLSSSVMYVERGDRDRDRENVIEIARALMEAGSDALLIVDDCPASLHDDLARIRGMPKSQFRLLTMDFDLGPITDRATKSYELTPQEQEPVVREMILEGQSASRISESDVDEAVRFAQGYPEIARLILDVWRSGGTVGTTLRGHDRLVQRILFGREEPDQNSLKMLEAMAVFKYFGYQSSNAQAKPAGVVAPEAQYEFVAEQMCEGATIQKLYEGTRVFMRRGVLEEGGELIRVRPRPLALYLAARWWERQYPGNVPAFLEAVEKVGLTEPLCQQMELLGEVEYAQEIAERLCGVTGPFGQAETLSTATGARVLRALAMVQPSAALGALDHAFGTMTTEELLAVEGGRYDLVRTLETLVWNPDLFATAGRLLLRFAAAENESFSNNATGQHRQLYRLSLSGTETPAEDRLPVLEEALNSSDTARRIAAVQGLGSALNVGYASRMAGSERAGGKAARVEWRPSTREEEIDYLKTALQIIAGIAVEEGNVGEVARGELLPRLAKLWTIQPMIVPVTDAIRRIVAAQPEFGEAAFRELSRALDPSERAPSFAERGVLESLRDELRPTDSVGRLRSIVIAPLYEETRRKKVDGSWEDIGLPKAEALAEEFIRNDVDWGPLLDELNGSYGDYVRAFGRRVGALCDRAFVERVLDHLESIEERAWSFTGGVLLSRPEAEQEEARDRVASSEELQSGYAALAAVIGIGTQETLLRLFKTGVLGWQALQTVRHALQSFPDDQLDAFLRTVIEVRADLLGTVFDVVALWKRPKALLRDLLAHEDTFEQTRSSAWGDQWGYAALEALNDGDRELAASMAVQVVKGAESNLGALDHSLKKVASRLLSDYRDVAWPVFREVLDDPQRAFELMDVLGASRWGHAPLFSAFPVQDLIEWAKDVNHMPGVLARSAPVFASEELTEDGPAGATDSLHSPAWHPTTLELIRAFGHDKDFLISLGANLASFSSAGSRVPYYEARLALLRELLTSKHEAVRGWARQEIDQYNVYVEGEVAEHEERRLRYG